MGEYAKLCGHEVKIGTCESMYYLRLEDAFKVQPIRGNVDPRNDLGLRFRLPFPDEDNIQTGHYEVYNRGVRLFKMVKDHMNREYPTEYAPAWLKDAEPGTLQLTHKSGLLLNVPCHHGVKLPEGINAHWNGKSHSMELSSVKRTAGGVVPIVHCRHCEQAWRTTWDEVLPFVHDVELRARLAKHESQSVEAQS